MGQKQTKHAHQLAALRSIFCGADWLGDLEWLAQDLEDRDLVKYLSEVLAPVLAEKRRVTEQGRLELSARVEREKAAREEDLRCREAWQRHVVQGAYRRGLEDTANGILRRNALTPRKLRELLQAADAAGVTAEELQDELKRRCTGSDEQELLGRVCALVSELAGEPVTA